MRHPSACLSFRVATAALVLAFIAFAASAPLLAADALIVSKQAPDAIRAVTKINSSGATASLRPPVGPLAATAPKVAAPPATAPISSPLRFIADAFRRVWLAEEHLQGDLVGWAIASRKDRLINWLLQLAVNPNPRDSGGMTPLLHAVAAEDLALAARLLDLGADPNFAGPRKITPLMLASSTSNSEFVAALLQRGAQVDAADTEGRRAIHYALAARQPTVLTALLAAKASVSNPDVFPLAAATRDWKLIGPVLERVSSRSWDAPARVLLNQALDTKNVDRLRLLISRHKGPATPEGSKEPLLAYAVIQNNLEVARLLLEAGADPNTTLAGKPEGRLLALVPFKGLNNYLTSEPGMNVLILAAGMGRKEMIDLLLAHGADKNRATRSKYRLIPLYFAAWGNHAACIQALIGNAPPPSEMRLEISLSAQQAVLYKNGVSVFRTEISSGQPEKPTPTGQFVITDKKREHISNIYQNARMPFFMRLSCKDFGLHEGQIPGYPASHGCIRLPGDAARKLFKDVPIGTLVTIR